MPKRLDRVSMFVVPERVKQNQASNRGQRIFSTSRDGLLARENFRQNQSQDQNDVQRRFQDEHDVPGIPLLPEWPERSHTIIVGEIQQNMAEAGNVRKEKEQAPARRKAGNVGLLSPRQPHQVHEAGDESRNQ